MVMNAMKVDLTVIRCILYIAMVYNDRDTRTEKLKMIENRKDYFKMAYKVQFNTQITSPFTMKLGFYRKICFDLILEQRGIYFSRC